MDRIDQLRDLIQVDVNGRGLRTDPAHNLVTSCAGDFRHACSALAKAERPVLLIVTGFYIASANPPAAETDGPLGAIFLCRALVPLGFRIALATDAYCVRALEAGLVGCGLREHVPIVTLPAERTDPASYLARCLSAAKLPGVTHLLAIERVGPNHTLVSFQGQRSEAPGETVLDFLDAVPEAQQDRCHNMRGDDIDRYIGPAHLLFEAARAQGIATVGIGDGGNEIGMGKIPWEVIHRNIPRGGLIACRVPTDDLIVCGISNWGAYALAAGVAHLRRQALAPRLFDPAIEQKMLQQMVRFGPLVDAPLRRPSATVDGLAWDRYAAVMQQIGALAH